MIRNNNCLATARNNLMWDSVTGDSQASLFLLYRLSASKASLCCLQVVLKTAIPFSKKASRGSSLGIFDTPNKSTSCQSRAG